MTTVQRTIAEEYACHIEKKIENLTKSLPEAKEKAVNIFKKLVSRVDEDFNFSEVRYKEVYKMVSSIRNSKSRGENELSNCFLREIPQYVSLALTHLFNNMVRSGVYPAAFKTSRIIPLLKETKTNLNWIVSDPSTM